MPCYDRINGSLKQVKTIYDRIGGALKEVKTGYDRIGGALKVYHQSGLRLGDLPLGSKIGYKDVYYTLIAHDGVVSGDSVLWTIYGKDARGTGVSATTSSVTSSTPFGTNNTNQVTIKYVVRSGSTSNALKKEQQRSATGYGFILPVTTLNLGNVEDMEFPQAFPYFNSGNNNTNASRRIRYNTKFASNGSAYQYWTPSMSYDSDDDGEYWATYIYVGTNGAFGSDNYLNASNDIFAYSVHADLRCTKNSDGTYTLNI